MKSDSFVRTAYTDKASLSSAGLHDGKYLTSKLQFFKSRAHVCTIISSGYFWSPRQSRNEQSHKRVSMLSWWNQLLHFFVSRDKLIWAALAVTAAMARSAVDVGRTDVTLDRIAAGSILEPSAPVKAPAVLSLVRTSEVGRPSTKSQN